MDFIIREIEGNDRAALLSLMREFYSSDAVMTNGSDEIFSADIDACLADSPFLSGYVFELGGEIVGYAMTAHSFSTEFGRPCVWIEDLYIKDEYRGKGFGSAFFDYIEARCQGVLFRLEAEEENHNAVSLYKKRGFRPIGYLEMIKGVD